MTETESYLRDMAALDVEKIVFFLSVRRKQL